MIHRNFVRMITFVLVLLAGNGQRAEPLALEAIPKVDVHAHMYARLPELAALLERLNFLVVNNCDGGNDPALMAAKGGWIEAQHAAWPKQFAFAPAFDLTHRDDGDYGPQVDRYFEGVFAAGAVMIKLYKEVGLEIKDSAGAYIMPDDGRFDSVYAYLAKHGRPLMAHLAEPRAAWLPLDPESVHYRYYSRHPEWHFYGRDDIPSWESIIEARSRLLEKHPDLTMIGAHLGSMAYDVAVLGTYFDEHPNFFADVAARVGDLSWQDSGKVREFFVRYQDRLLFGSDIGIDVPEGGAFTPEELEKTLAGVEKHYRMTWQYFTGEGTVEISGREVECLNLPRDVVEKFYYGNAVRLIPDLIP